MEDPLKSDDLQEKTIEDLCICFVTNKPKGNPVPSVFPPQSSGKALETRMAGAGHLGVCYATKVVRTNINTIQL